MSEKGCLSNWWAGCEPVGTVLSTLLKDGFFYNIKGGLDNSPAVGYLFRGNNIRKLVFVFTNEYDNQIVRRIMKYGGDKWRYEPYEYVFVPSLDNKVASLEELSLTTKGITGYTSSSSDQNPPDPYCFQMVKQLPAIRRFLNSIGLGEDKEIISAYSEIGKWFNSSSSNGTYGGQLPDLKYPMTSLTFPKKEFNPKSFSSINRDYNIYGYNIKYELNNLNQICEFLGQPYSDIIKKHNSDLDNKEYWGFPGIDYQQSYIDNINSKIIKSESFDYSVGKTLGFYDL